MSLKSKDNFQEIINKHRAILDLDDNWDSKGAKRIKIETYRKAFNFLEKLYDSIQSTLGKTFPEPAIIPGKNGNIQIEWTDDNFFLIISVKEDTDIIRIFGRPTPKPKDDKRYLRIKLKIDTEISMDLIMWLKRML